MFRSASTVAAPVLLLLYTAGLCLAGSARAQGTAPPEVKKITGCVTAAKDVPGAYVVANETMCARITDGYTPGKALGHVVIFEGTQVPPGGGNPILFTPKRTVSVGLACTETCSVGPPPGRGVHKSSKGSDASTSGITTPHP